jgi:ZIP family zinc transporter
MPFVQLLILGALAGFTIYIGLPVAAFRALKPRAAGALNGIATGILLFLTVDVLSNVLASGGKIVEGWARGQPVIPADVGTITLLIVGAFVGLVGIPLIESSMIKPMVERSRSRQASLGRESTTPGSTLPPTALAFSIAASIGLHNLGEGLAIGQAAAAGAIPLAFTLIIGFGLHNMTEGFGIAAPLANSRPSGGLVFLLGLIGGGPTLMGTLIGSSWTSDQATVIFLSIAGGSLAYVVPELLMIGRHSLKKAPLMACVALGFFVGYFTDLIAGIATGA